MLDDRQMNETELLSTREEFPTLAKGVHLISHSLGETIASSADRISVSPELSALFLPRGVPSEYRARLVRPELAKTIRRFGSEGAKIFYEGTVGAKIVAAVQAAGGTLELSDLAAYRVKERAPLERTIAGRTIYRRRGTPRCGRTRQCPLVLRSPDGSFFTQVRH